MIRGEGEVELEKQLFFFLSLYMSIFLIVLSMKLRVGEFLGIYITYFNIILKTEKDQEILFCFHCYNFSFLFFFMIKL